MNRASLAHLSKDDLIALLVAQAEVIGLQTGQIATLTKQVEALEAKLGKPPKTPDNSSVPPSQGQKPNRAARRAAGKRTGRPGVSRALSEKPDQMVVAQASACPHCDHTLSAADQPRFHAYDH